MDWNWFFSSLSQSAAAIVGIFGAFIITKILSNQALFGEKIRKCQDVTLSCQKVAERAKDLSIAWYNTRITEEELEDLEDIFKENDSMTPAQYYDQLNFSIYLSRKYANDAISKYLDKRKERIEREERNRAPRVSSVLGSFELPRFETLNLPTNIHIRPQLEKERDAIDSVYNDAKYHSRLATTVLTSVEGNPESSNQITYSLALVTVLFSFGVVYPLSFLPASSSTEPMIALSAFVPVLLSFKGLLLSIVSLIFGGILVLFFWLNISLKYPKELIENLHRFKELSSYSEFFQTRDLNESTGAESHDG